MGVPVLLPTALVDIRQRIVSGMEFVLVVLPVALGEAACLFTLVFELDNDPDLFGAATASPISAFVTLIISILAKPSRSKAEAGQASNAEEG
jgi:hypothetical protein